MDLRHLWGLDPSVDFLNHGSFGAAPLKIRQLQLVLQKELESQPVEFLARRLPERLLQVRRRLGLFLGADPARLALIPNASTGVATVLNSFDWREGDEVVLADHAYNAVRRSIAYLGHRYGVREALATVPFPLQEAGQIVEAFARAIGPPTRLILVDHITSATALVFPVAEIIALGRQRGIPVLVDGAHAPGSLHLELDRLGADFYTGNLHKWVCTPKGSAFLYVAPAWRDRVHPLVISHGYGAGFEAEFDWIGTADPSPWLCIPAALEFQEGLGWEQTRAYNHALVMEGRELLAHALGVKAPIPDDRRLSVGMAVVPFPGRALPGVQQALNARMYKEHRIEVPFTAYDDRLWLRVSAQRYNHLDQYRRLAKVLASGWPG
ncbi:MAG TPA: aminotransferase class V-fold PLP-dependent enzyme [Myxococcota bacterium]|nr:aminotransferase class V-fold PLP-dependent enzyme [Myxococcota bacterium]